MKKSRRYLLNCGWRSSHLYTRQPSKANLILKPGVLEDLRQFISMGAHLNLTSYEIEILKLYPGTYFSVSHIHWQYQCEYTVEHRRGDDNAAKWRQEKVQKNDAYYMSVTAKVQRRYPHAGAYFIGAWMRLPSPLVVMFASSSPYSSLHRTLRYSTVLCTNL